MADYIEQYVRDAGSCGTKSTQTKRRIIQINKITNVINI